MSRLLTYQQLLTLIACVNKVKPRYEDHYAAVAEEFCRETSLQWSATETYEKFWLAFTGQLAENFSDLEKAKIVNSAQDVIKRTQPDLFKNVMDQFRAEGDLDEPVETKQSASTVAEPEPTPRKKTKGRPKRDSSAVDTKDMSDSVDSVPLRKRTRSATAAAAAAAEAGEEKEKRGGESASGDPKLTELGGFNDQEVCTNNSHHYVSGDRVIFCSFCGKIIPQKTCDFGLHSYVPHSSGSVLFCQLCGKIVKL